MRAEDQGLAKKIPTPYTPLRKGTDMKKLSILLALILLFAIYFPLFAQDEETVPSSNDDVQVIQTQPEETPAIPVESTTSETPDESTQSNPNSTASMGSEQPEIKHSDTISSYSATPIPTNSSFTGASSYNIPISVPPGRNGMAPKINIIYTSQGENSWIGHGWNLDMGSIRRSTKNGLNYNDNAFVYSGNGVSVDLLIQPNWGPNYFEARVEENFQRFFYNSASGGWEVTQKDGTRFYYGSDDASRQSNNLGVFKWCLDKVEDTNGNYMTFIYTKDQGEIYLSRINYTQHIGLPQTTYASYVKFNLEPRTDAAPLYRINTLVVTAYRLSSVEVYTNNNLVRKYSLNYRYSENTFRSLLTTVTLFGSDGTTSLPPINFSYQTGGKGWTPMNGITNAASPGQPMVMGDFNGDNKTDIGFVYGDGVHFYLSDGQGGWTKINDIANDLCPSAGYELSHYWDPRLNYCPLVIESFPMVIGDFNGDGKTDVGRKYQGGIRIYLSNSQGGWTKINDLLDNDLQMPNYLDYGSGVYPVITGDFNSDGKTDIGFVYNNGVRFYLSNGQGGWTKINDIQNDLCPSAGYWAEAYTPMVTGDFDGDGKTDVARLSINGLRVYFADGQGGWTRKDAITGNYCVSPIPQQLSWSAGLCPVTTGDFNGDGKTDVAIVHINGVYVFLSTGRANWVRIKDIPDLGINQGFVDYSGGLKFPLAIGDFNGDGKTDIGRIHDNGIRFYTTDGRDGWVRMDNLNDFGAASSFENGCADYPMVIGDFNGDGKTDVGRVLDNAVIRLYSSASPFPDLLSTVTNGFGDKTTINYIPSSQSQNTLLPFIVQTTSAITTEDGIGNISSTHFAYSGGLYDYLEKEFQGFATSTKINPDGTREITQFYQDYFRKGQPKQTQSYAPEYAGGVLMGMTDYSFKMVGLSSGVTHVMPLQKRSEFYDSETVFTQEDYAFDHNGNLLMTTTWGSGLDEAITKTNDPIDYGASNRQVWRNRTETVIGSQSGQVRQSIYVYENNTGNLLSKSAWLESGNNPATSMQYDTYGNVLHAIDAWGNASSDPWAHATHTDFDSETNTFPVKVTAPKTGSAAHITQTGWNRLYNQPAWTKDENGNIISYQYDVFGRLTLTQNPDGGSTQIIYSDVSDPNAFPRYLLTKIKEDAAGNTIDKYEFFDGLGRPIQTTTFGEDEKPIISRTYYNNMGQTALTEGPFFASGVTYPQTAPLTGYPFSWTSYDFRGRPLIVKSKHGDYLKNNEYIATSFDYSGFSATVTDPDGNRKTEKKDYLGRIIEVIEHNDPEAYRTTYQYNVAGDLLKVTDVLSHETNLEYDTLGRKKVMVDPDMGRWEYSYDPNGNLLTQKDAKNQEIRFEYDALNRPLNKKYFFNDQPSTNDIPVFTTYDNATPGSNGIGKPYTITKGNVVITNNAYDFMGRSLKVTKRIDTTDYVTQNEYELSGKVKKLLYPDNYFITYDYYPGTNLIQTITDSANVVQAVYTDYEPTGKIGQIDYHNGTATKYTYDAWSTKLFGIVTEDPTHDPNKYLQNREYTYSRAGDVLRIEDHVQKVSYDYAYDPLHRLISENLSGTSAPLTNKVEEIVLDYENIGPVHGVKEIRLNGISKACSYDANGNMVISPDFTNEINPLNRNILYNSDNMPFRIVHANGITVDFTYDGTGKRSEKLVPNGKTILYIGDHYEIENGIAIKYIFGGNLRLAQIKGSLTSYFHKDHLGSTAAVTDENGQKTEVTLYEPYGSVHIHEGAEVTAYKFTDQEFDNETNLYNYDARLYDPITGMFITPDSVMANPLDPQSFNRFSYCRNNPLIYLDPTGHSPSSVDLTEDLYHWSAALRTGADYHKDSSLFDFL
ncbi:MAG: hypothetical protein EHM45_06880, partial [Desulfobacteraceae bacterium]